MTFGADTFGYERQQCECGLRETPKGKGIAKRTWVGEKWAQNFWANLGCVTVLLTDRSVEPSTMVSFSHAPGKVTVLSHVLLSLLIVHSCSCKSTHMLSEFN